MTATEARTVSPGRDNVVAKRQLLSRARKVQHDHLRRAVELSACDSETGLTCPS